MKIERSSGILLHITSLPGNRGIGTLGDEAFEFVDILKEAGQTSWQILPIGPVSPSLGYSPYASTSTFAGNFLFISLDKLSGTNWFSRDINKIEFNDKTFVDFEAVIEHKLAMLTGACTDFFAGAGAQELTDYEKFCAESTFWLDDYALFASLAEHFNTNNWFEWEAPISKRDPEAINKWSSLLKEQIKFHKFVQYLFFSQWHELKEYCNEKGIQIIGDIPIYITLDGADAWAHREIFLLDETTGKPLKVSGVPPDYFSETGQRWGNPLYNWEDSNKRLNPETLLWWVKRIRHIHNQVDIIRIDHFRGFESYWAIDAEEETAINGKWEKGPGIEFFHRLEKELGELPLIAEDLGVITPEVEKLRDDLELPGMKILQFAFDFNNKNYYLPHNYTNPNYIAYTGTHDNNTTNGWFYGPEVDENRKQYILEYMGSNTDHDFHWQLIRLAYMSVAELVIFPVQDILGYGADFRMNIPGTTEGNWGWKLTKGAITGEITGKLRRMGDLYDRIVTPGNSS
ncbi:MAG: 4-alpha-glucanotransferase [bacterium]|nr:4-alpha-glucanotransferase [bacterium]